MATITVKSNADMMAKALREIGEKSANFAIKDALKRAGQKMRTTAARTIPKQAKPLMGKDVRAKSSAFARPGVAGVRASSSAMIASDPRLKAKETGTGAQYKAWDRTIFVPRGFIPGRRGTLTAKIPPSIFQRVDKPRLPIEHEGYGPSVAHELARKDQPAQAEVLVAGRMHVDKRLVQNIDRIVKAAKGKYGL